MTDVTAQADNGGIMNPLTRNAKERDTMLKKQVNRPAECEGLGPLVGNGFAIGHHEDVTGLDAALADFQLTRAELITLAYDYLERHYNVETTGAMGYSGSWEWRESVFTWRRFCTIAEVLSPGKNIKHFEVYIERREAEIEKIRRRTEEAVANQYGPDWNNGESDEDKQIP